jgi:hypothetical protein
MKTLILCLALTCASRAFAADDTPQSRSQEADRYLAATPPAELLGSLVTQMAKNVPADQRQAFIDTMSKNFDMVALTQSMKTAMVKDFTTEELKALADFYGSPVAKSAMGKIGTYMADVMPAIQAEVMKAVAKTGKDQADKAKAQANAAAASGAVPAAPPAHGP